MLGKHKLPELADVQKTLKAGRLWPVPVWPKTKQKKQAALEPLAARQKRWSASSAKNSFNGRSSGQAGSHGTAWKPFPARVWCRHGSAGGRHC